MKEFLILVLIFSYSFSFSQENKSDKQNQLFSFVFMTDTHLQPERNAIQGFQKAINSVNDLKPDFVILGGDNVTDVLAQNWERADSLYRILNSMLKSFEMPVYITIGNHELFGVYEQSGVSPDHQDYGKKMFEKWHGERFYTFENEGWQFIVLDGIGITKARRYKGLVDSTQLQWLGKQLQFIGKEKPIVVSIHIPLLSVESHFALGPNQAFKNNSIVNNANEVREVLKGYNVKLVLQGHTHFLEDIYHNGIHYVTGGAVSSSIWNGKRFGMEEGFLLIHVFDDEQFTWKYIDYGWEVPKNY